MTYDYDNRIEAYLNQEMPAAEKKAFEAELSTNEVLRTELERCRRLNAALSAYSRQKLRRLAGEIRGKVGAVPEPQLSFFDRLRYFFYTPVRIYILLAALLTTGLFLTVQVVVTPVPGLIANHFFEPLNPFIAGAAPAQRTVFYDAARFYWNGPADSLMYMTGNAPGVYYLAHWFLARQKFVQAGTYFDQTLAQRQVMDAYLDDWGKIKFNHLLAALGAGQSRRQIRTELKALLDDPDCSGEARSNASALLQDLENPLRWLLVR